MRAVRRGDVDVCGLTVAVATYRRPLLLRQCLESLGSQEGVYGTWTVLVVDNDPEGSARRIVERFASSASMRVRYELEPRPGIAAARNAAVRCSASARMLAFIDDDEVAESRWLAELVSSMARHDADVVQGQVRSQLEPGGPMWVVEGGFFDRSAEPDGAMLTTAITGSVLVKLEALPGSEPFDHRFGTTGGEDTMLFAELSARGRRIVSAPAARVVEHVPLERQRVGWLVRRNLRSGGVWAIVEREVGLHRWRRTRRVASAGAHVVTGSFLLLSGVLSRRRSRAVTGMCRAALGLGMFHGLAGYALEEYRRP